MDSRTKMKILLLFSIPMVFCFGTGVTSGMEVSEADESISYKEKPIYTPVDTAVNKEIHFNGSQLKADGIRSVLQVDECTCKNGECVRECDKEKTTPCDDQRKVCVCNPEFGKKDDDECEYCDCGEGFGCTFKMNVYGKWKKTCMCPDDYYRDTDSSIEKCRKKCIYWKRPCQRGGTCSYSGKCYCPPGIEGDLCETIGTCRSKCENRLEVNCLYDWDARVVICRCKNSSLYYDEKADICKPCSCEKGSCGYKYVNSEQKLICYCPNDYKEFNGYCKECNCGFGVQGECEFDSNGEKICKCWEGFYEREGHCWPCNCMSWSDTDTKCEVVGNTKRCFCKEGYQDVDGHCEKLEIDPCETNNTCHPTAKCFNVFGKIECECPDGYKGIYGRRSVEPGERCIDIDECTDTYSECRYSYTKNCINLPGSYKCECIRGYQPESYLDKPQGTVCIQTSVNVVPGVIVFLVTAFLIFVLCGMHRIVKNRALRSN